MAAPRLRGHRQAADTLYPLGEIPSDIVTAIGKELLWTIACGETDIAGDRWSEMFAAVIGVPHTKSNRTVRLISGRNDVNFSFPQDIDIADAQKTGGQVLSIWNDRVDRAREVAQDLRTIILVRNYELTEFLLFERETSRYNLRDYRWGANAQGNYEAVDAHHNEHRFTWQLGGAQFTVIEQVPASALWFQIHHLTPLSKARFIADVPPKAVDLRGLWGSAM